MPGLHFDSSIDRGFEKDLDRMNRKMNKFSGNVQKKGVTMENTFKRVGANLSAMVSILAIGAAGKGILDFSKDLETALIEVATISTAVTEDFEGYKQLLIEMSTEQDLAASSAKQLTEAFYDIVSAGNDGADGLLILEATARASTAGFVEASIAADGLTTVINAWGKSAADAAAISDIFFKTVEKGKTTFPQLGSNIAQVAPIAASMGVSFEEISGAIATLTKSGTPTAQAFTQIRSALLSMNKVLGDGWAELMTFQEGLVEVRKRASGSTNVLREMLGRVEAVNAVLGLTGKNAASAASDLKAMNNALGATEIAAQKVVNTTQHQINTLRNNILAAFTPLGEGAIKIIADLAKRLNDAFEDGSFQDFLDIVKILIRTLLIYKASVIAITVARRIHTAALYQNIRAQRLSSLTGRKVTAVNIAMARSLRVVSAAFKANPIGLLVTGLSLAIPLISRFTSKTDDGADAQKDFNDELERGNDLLNERKFFDLENIFIKAGLSLNNFAGEYEQVLKLVKENFNLEVDSLSLLKEKIELRLKALQLQKLEIEEDVPAIGDQIQTLNGLVNVTKEYQKELKARNKEQAKVFDVEINAQQKLLDYLNQRITLLKKDKKTQTLDRLAQLKIEHQKRINSITEEYAHEEDAQKEFHVRLLQNELLYLNKLKDLTDDELKELKIEEKLLIIKVQITDIKKQLSPLEEELQRIFDEIEIEDVVVGIDIEQDSFKDALEIINGLNEVMENVVADMDNLEDSIKNILEGVIDMSSGILSLVKAVDLLGDKLNALDKASVILLVISSILKIITAINNTIAKQLEIKEQNYINELSKIQAVNVALIEQNRLYEEGNEFFSDDKWGTALKALETYNLSLQYQKELLNEISGSTQTLPDNPNLLTGWGGLFAAYREAYDIRNIQNDAQNYATELEKALGSVAVKIKDRGGFANFFGFKDSFESLLEIYPDVIDANGELDEIVLKTIIDTADLSDAEKERLENLLELTEQARQSYAEFGNFIASTFGGVADEVAQAFQEMYESGDDAMISLGESFSEMIESFTRDAIEFALLQPLLNELNKITKGLGEQFAKGDISADELQSGIINALGDFYSSLNDITPEILRAYENADRLAEEAGFAEAFNPQTEIDEAAQSVAGQIQQAITEETGSMLVGRMGAIMLSSQQIANDGADALEYAIQNLVVMKQIKNNTDYLPAIAENTRKTYEKLESI